MANTNHKSDSDIGAELAEWRDKAGLSQKEAAQLLGLASDNTISRWETGLRRPRAADYKHAMDLYQRRFAERQSQPVPRGTVPVAGETYTPFGETDHNARIARAIELFKREAVRMGATDPEIDHIQWSLNNPRNARLFYLGDDDKPLTDAQQEEQFGYQVEALRLWLERRIERRNAEERKKK